MKARAIAAVVLLLAVAGLGLAWQLGRSRGATAAQPAPDFRLDALDGTRFYLNAQRGRPVALVFWETTCRICKQEMLELQAVADASTDSAVVAAVCLDPANRDAVADIARQLNLRYPVLLDGSGTVRDAYGVQAVPTTVVIDAKGRERLRRVGYDETVRRQIRETLRNLAAGGAPTP